MTTLGSSVTDDAVGLAAAWAPALASPAGAAVALAGLRAWAAGAGCGIYALPPDPAAPGPRLAVRPAAGRGLGRVGLAAGIVPAVGEAAGLEVALPTGLWSACLALATVAHARGGAADRLVALLHAGAPASGEEEPASLDASAHHDGLLGALHVVIGGDGGIPYDPGGGPMLPLVVGARGVVWAAVHAVDDVDSAAAPRDLATAGNGGAIAKLLAALSVCSGDGPDLDGPLLRAVIEAHDRAQAGGLAWRALLDPERRPGALAALSPGAAAYIRGLCRVTATVTGLDGGEQLDRAACRARALVDLRVPADASLDVARGWLGRIARPGVVVDELGHRPPRLAPLAGPVPSALARRSAALADIRAMTPAQARRSEPADVWRGLAAPRYGLAPARVDPGIDADLALRLGYLAVEPAGLRWGAALYAAVVGDVAGAG